MIVFLSLSTADQRIWLLPAFRPGEVNRTSRIVQCVGGKAVNAARTASLLGAPVRLFGIVSPPLAALLEAEGIPVHGAETEPLAERVRCATSIVDLERGAVTELVEEALPPGPGVVERITASFIDAGKRAAAACLCGSLPAGTGPDVYARIVRELGDVPVIVDAQGEPLRLALGERPFLVKPNVHEAARLLGDSAGHAGKAVALATALCDRGARYAAVSYGSKGLALAGDGEPVRFVPPVVNPVNSTGCGDAVTGGTACGLSRGMSIREAVRLGVECAAASALEPVPGAFTTSAKAALSGHVHLVP